jgi:hypothetical protein
LIPLASPPADRRYNDSSLIKSAKAIAAWWLEGLTMWMRRLAFPSFVFFMVGFMFVMLGWACGMFRSLFLW